MAKVVGPELPFEPIGGPAERTGHDSGVRDDEVELFVVGEERVGAGAHAGQVIEIELDQFEAAAVCGSGANRFSRAIRLVDVAYSPYDNCPMGRERAGRLHSKAGGHASDQDALATQVNAVKHLVGR